MEEERILTKHPQGKAGVNILKSKYEVIKEFILETLEENKEHPLVNYVIWLKKNFLNLLKEKLYGMLFLLSSIWKQGN